MQTNSVKAEKVTENSPSILQDLQQYDINHSPVNLAILSLDN